MTDVFCVAYLYLTESLGQVRCVQHEIKSSSTQCAFKIRMHTFLSLLLSYKRLNGTYTDKVYVLTTKFHHFDLKSLK